MLFAQLKGEEMSAVIGEFADIESIMSIKDLFNRLGSDNFEIRSRGQPKVSPDLRCNYLMNSRIMGLEEADLLLLVGTNPRQESPVLNARILRNVKNNRLKVFLIGTPVDLTYDYVHLGTSTKIIEEIMQGKHKFFDRLKKAKLPMILMGSNVLERDDGQEIYDMLRKIAITTPVTSKASLWNGFNILHKYIGHINALELGISLTKPKNQKPQKLIFLMGVDNNIKPQDIPKDAFVVYMVLC